MATKFHCSNCGEEIENISIGWGKYQWLWGLLSFLPLVFCLFWFKNYVFADNDFGEQIEVAHTETRSSENRIDVLGTLRNLGDESWDRVTVEAEFFGADGQFVDETSDYISVKLVPGSEENFRLTLSNPAGELGLQADPKVVLKVTDASTSRF